MINFYSYKKKSYLVSLILISLTIVIIFLKGLNLGIDFKGGLNFEVRTNLSNEQIFDTFQEINTNREIIVKKEIGSDVHTIRIETGNDNAAFIEEINQLIQNHPEMEVLISEYIEPTFSDELIKNSLYAMISSLVVIAFYIWIRFDWQFAASGIFALLHDVFIAIGFMSLFNIEFNLTMIAALLLIAGYSINDTIVLFDRLRTLTSDENNKDSFPDNVNNSIKLNLRRTILTSFTTILALICLVILAPVNLT
jgi:preprotein translocase SecF subunit